MSEEFSKKLFYHGHYFRFNSRKGGSIYYKCSKYDSSRCRARLNIKNGNFIIKGVHTCSQDSMISVIPQPIDSNPTEFADSFITQKSQCLEIYPNQIFQSLLLALREKYDGTPYPIPTKKNVYKMVREQRSSIYSNSIQAAMLPPLRDLPNGQPFFRRYWSGDIEGEYHQMFIWCTNEALSLMRYNSHTFIDCTFRSVPAPFIQCLIIMVHDIGTELFVPCAYCLLTSKNEYLYLTAFHEIIVLTKYHWMPRIITSDFEVALISAIKHEFPESRLLCCYFHLKQAIERKLKKLKFSSEISSIILSNIQLLTVVPIEEINLAIQFIKTLTNDEENLSLFWDYFHNTWVKRFDPILWNFSNTDDLDIVGRTNNALERYNRRLGDHFFNAHPNICMFISVIKNEFLYYSEKCKEIRQNFSGIRYQAQRFLKPDVEKSYQTWKSLQ